MSHEYEASEVSSLTENAHLDYRSIPHVAATQQQHTHKGFAWRYYIPCYSWMSEYKLEMLPMDLLAGMSLASYQIPLSISFATALAHVPTASGLLGLTLGPMVYTLMGSVPQMIVGPEAAVSMVLGQTIDIITKHHTDADVVDVLSAIVFLSGLTLVIFSLLRFGFIANVLSATLLKGFITAIGLSMMVSSTLSMCGLTPLLKDLPKNVHVHTTIDKLIFLIEHLKFTHESTAIVGFSSLFILITLRKLKHLLIKKFKFIQYFPEILLVVISSTILSYALDLHSYDIEVVGKVSLNGIQLRNPLSYNVRQYFGEVFPVAFICSILGFFETSTAANSIGSNLEMPVSNNRELLSIGTCGLVVSAFGALTSFGGYARSKLNVMIGGKSPLSGFFMGLTTLIVTWKFLDYIYYLPLCVLNSVIFMVGFSMIEETPKELKFHIRLGGWSEIITFFVTLLASLFYSIEIGVGMGCFYSVMRVLRHSTQSRIQILSRIAGTDTFANSEVDTLNSETSSLFRLPKKVVVPGYKEYRRESMTGQTLTLGTSLPMKLTPSKIETLDDSNIFPDLQDREGCLIVKIPEPLTFFNANDMRSRLKRIELYGSTHGDPNLKRRDPKSIRHVVFDLHGMTSIDSCATEILFTIVQNFQKRGINVFFCRLVKSKLLLDRLVDSGINDMLMLNQGPEFGVNQTLVPYYDEILDALKAIDIVDSTCDWETRSFMSRMDYDV